MGRHHKWANLGLKAYLEEELSTTVLLDNNVRLATIGEVERGVDAPLNEMMYISCGTGIGAGVYINGKIHEGCNRAAGEIGNFMLGDGRNVESVVAYSGLASRIEEAFGKKNNPISSLDFERITELSKTGDDVVNECIAETGRILGLAIYNACVLLDIQNVILGGDYVHLGDVLFNAIDEFISQKSHSQHAPFRATVQRSRLLDTAGLYGGLILGKDRVLSERLASGA